MVKISDEKPRWYALHHDDDGELFDVVFACNGEHAKKYYDHECGTGLPFPGYESNPHLLGECLAAVIVADDTQPNDIPVTDHDHGVGERNIPFQA